MWSKEDAFNGIWRDLYANAATSETRQLFEREMRELFGRHLQAAHDAGVSNGHAVACGESSGEYDIGNIVYLKSGGPPMTVTGICAHLQVDCIWFTDDGNRQQALFGEATLTKNKYQFD